MIFWSLCAFIWFRNMKKMLLQMTSVSLQPVPSLYSVVNLKLNRYAPVIVGTINKVSTLQNTKIRK
jgi:hypothetical protein